MHVKYLLAHYNMRPQTALHCDLKTTLLLILPLNKLLNVDSMG